LSLYDKKLPVLERKGRKRERTLLTVSSLTKGLFEKKKKKRKMDLSAHCWLQHNCEKGKRRKKKGKKDLT